MTRRSLGRKAAIGLAAVALIVALIAGYREWGFRHEFASARADMMARRLDPARVRLERLASLRPWRLDVAYELAVCRQALGDVDGALAAWARFGAEPEYSERAALYQEQAYLAKGRWSEVERVLASALEHPGPLARDVRSRLARLLRFEGRVEEVERMIESAWAGATDDAEAASLLGEHSALDLEPFPVEMIESILSDAGRKAPEDDRVWLGKANWATRSGRFAEAEAWLGRCRERRPDDPAVWLARLDWGVAADRVAEARDSLGHIPARLVRPGRPPELRAWFASRGADPALVRRTVEDWREADPGSATALERLAEIEGPGGNPGRAAELRRKKAELDRDRRLYRSIISGGNLASRAPELAALATSQGRWFEARGWWTSALAADPSSSDAKEALARLGPTGLGSIDGTATLATLLGDIARRATLEARGVRHGVTPRFQDEAARAGLRFTYESGRSPLRQLPETMGGGAALLDYDGDGWLDLYVVQGGPFPPDASATGDKLFHSRRDGTFEDATAASGIADFPRGYGHGVTVGDIDNDGHPDLFITRWRSYALYRNNGDGTFEDATARLGLGGEHDWPTSAAFADLDGDGDLDLYVCQYLRWDARAPRPCRNTETNAYIYCTPHILDSLGDRVYRNDGTRFVDVTEEAGIVDREGPGLGVVAADFDEDGRIDLFVANDGTANYLFQNRGGFRFRDIAHEAGVASSAQGSYQSGMGVAAGDLDGDGHTDVVVTNFYGEGTTFYRNFGGGQFADESAAIGLLALSRNAVGFGTYFLDYNNDGHLDVATVNGHVNDFRPKFPYAMPAQLLAGSGEGLRLADVTRDAGPSWSEPCVGRALTVGDIDNDGRVDAILVPHDSPIRYARNATEGGHSLTLLLQGGSSNRDAIGARVTVTSGGRRQVLQRTSGGSYQSSSDPRLHAGLGDSTRADSIEVRWPSGHVDRFENLDADRGYRLIEGRKAVAPLEGFGRL